MKSTDAAQLFEALSSDVRLDIFRLLVKHAPEGLVAGEIAKNLNLPSTNLSFHL
ncbi:helix-turn-helix domain-containing protein, partial [uncultured Desulfovibrio sp.]